ncbi:MAG: hypothetical protein WDO18_18335 [Acidobacteriota bacterium]
MAQLNTELRATVKEVIRLTPNIVEVVVKAPLAARAFLPGQFYRLQNFETLAPKTDGTVLGMEGLALTGASVDRKEGLLSTIVLEMGGSSDLCAILKPGEPVILMGPTARPPKPPRTKPFCWSVADSATPCSSASARNCEPRDLAPSTSPATKKSSTATKSTRSKRPPTSSSGVAMKRPGFTPAARRIALSWAISSKR